MRWSVRLDLPAGRAMLLTAIDGRREIWCRRQFPPGSKTFGMHMLAYALREAMIRHILGSRGHMHASGIQPLVPAVACGTLFGKRVEWKGNLRGQDDSPDLPDRGRIHGKSNWMLVVERIGGPVRRSWRRVWGPVTGEKIVIRGGRPSDPPAPDRTRFYSSTRPRP